MKTQRRMTFLALFILGALTGCSSTRVDLLRQGTVRVETSSESRGSIMPVFVYQTDQAMVITGDIRHIPRNTHEGRVAIEVIGPDGSRWAQQTASVTPGLWTRRSSRWPRFETEVPGVVPAGSVIKMRYERNR